MRGADLDIKDANKKTARNYLDELGYDYKTFAPVISFSTTLSYQLQVKYLRKLDSYDTECCYARFNIRKRLACD